MEVAAPVPGAPQRLRVLVVEDDPTTLSVALDTLETLGHWATGVKSAEIALDRFFESAFDVVMIDIGLPALSGRQLAEKLQARHRVPVIFCTAEAEPMAPSAGRLWLCKPYSIAQLSNALANACSLLKRPSGTA